MCEQCNVGSFLNPHLQHGGCYVGTFLCIADMESIYDVGSLLDIPDMKGAIHDVESFLHTHTPSGMECALLEVSITTRNKTAEQN